MRQEFGAADRGVLKALSDRFMVRTFRFSTAASRVDAEDDLTFAGAQTRLGAALDGARQELAGLPLAGLVVVSDGADTAEDALGESLLALKSQGVPVFTVGVGRETLPRDIQIGRVSTPRFALKGTTLMIDVIITQTGFAGKTVTLDVEDEGRIVGSQQVKLPDDGSAATARVRFTVAMPGARVFRFRVAPQDGELVTENNASRGDDRRPRPPREDPLLRGRAAVRGRLHPPRRRRRSRICSSSCCSARPTTSTSALGVDSRDELVAGFPKTREELFAYRGLILGSIEAGAFTGDQLQMIAEFVDRRGGGLLMLGGARSFSEGGYAGTAVADVLPLVLDPNARTPQLARLTVKPTRAGAAHGVTQIAETEAKSAEQWDFLADARAQGDDAQPHRCDQAGRDGAADRHRRIAARAAGARLPALRARQGVRLHAAGLLAVADAEADHRRGHDARIPLASAAAIARRRRARRRRTAVADRSRRAWRGAHAARRRRRRAVRRAERRHGRRPRHAPRRQHRRRADAVERRAQRRIHGDGADRRRGWYEARIEATRGGKTIGTTVAHVRAAPGDAEYFDATMHAADAAAHRRGNRRAVLHAGRMQGLAEDLRYTGRGVTTVEERDLWHLPIVFVLLVGLLCAEWGYRRAVGLS